MGHVAVCDSLVRVGQLSASGAVDSEFGEGSVPTGRANANPTSWDTLEESGEKARRREVTVIGQRWIRSHK